MGTEEGGGEGLGQSQREWRCRHGKRNAVTPALGRDKVCAHPCTRMRMFRV